MTMQSHTCYSYMIGYWFVNGSWRQYMFVHIWRPNEHHHIVLLYLLFISNVLSRFWSFLSYWISVTYNDYPILPLVPISCEDSSYMPCRLSACPLVWLQINVKKIDNCLFFFLNPFCSGNCWKSIWRGDCWSERNV